MKSVQANSKHFATFGGDASNKPFAGALAGLKLNALPEAEEQKKPSVSKNKNPPRVPLKREPLVALSENKEPTAHVVAVKENDLPVVRSCSVGHTEPQQGNVSIGRLFLGHKILLQFLNELHGKKEKAICTFFQQKKCEGKSGKIVRSFLVLRVLVRPGSRIALCVTPGGTGWLAKRFPVGMEFFLDELMCQREAPEGRMAATLLLRVIMDDVRAARGAAKNKKSQTRQMP